MSDKRERITRRQVLVGAGAMTAALGRTEEFRLHLSARSRAGVTEAEVDELLFQIAAYCGAPAGVSAKRAVVEVRSEEAGA